MHCASCAQNIEKSLKRHTGVKNASVNFATETAMVMHDPMEVGANDLIETIKKAGYAAQINDGPKSIHDMGSHD